jgi:AcrR family transcriptional regulator
MAKLVVTKNDLKECVVDAFFILLAEKGYADLTITSLVKKASVSLKYFYANFGSREGVVTYFLTQVLSSLPTKNIYDYKARIETAITSLQKHKERLLLLHKNGLTYLLLPLIQSDYLAITESKKLPFEVEHKILDYASSLFNLLYVWFDYDMGLDPKEMIAKTSIGNILEEKDIRIRSCFFLPK